MNYPINTNLIGLRYMYFSKFFAFQCSLLKVDSALEGLRGADCFTLTTSTIVNIITEKLRSCAWFFDLLPQGVAVFFP